MRNPDPNSIRSKKRRARGFKTLELSSRKHRRNAKRMGLACSLGGKMYAPGEKAEVKCGNTTWVHTAGGGVNFH